MSQRFMATGQVVGYDFSDKSLVVTIDEKMAQKMKADGWGVHYDRDMGPFVLIKMEE